MTGMSSQLIFKFHSIQQPHVLSIPSCFRPASCSMWRESEPCGSEKTKWSNFLQTDKHIQNKWIADNEWKSYIWWTCWSHEHTAISLSLNLPCVFNQYEFELEIEFFAKLLSSLNTLIAALQGPDSTLHTVVVLSTAACRRIEELRENLNAVFNGARHH